MCGGFQENIKLRFLGLSVREKRLWRLMKADRLKVEILTTSHHGYQHHVMPTSRELLSNTIEMMLNRSESQSTMAYSVASSSRRVGRFMW